MTQIPTRLLICAGIILLVAVAFWGYGRHEYSQGAKNERIKIEKVQEDIRKAQQVDKDKADADYRGKIYATQQKARDLDAKLVSTNRVLADLRGKLKSAGTCSGLNDAGTDWIGVLGESWAEYTDLGKETARLADKVGGLQGYIRAVSGKKGKGLLQH